MHPAEARAPPALLTGSVVRHGSVLRYAAPGTSDREPRGPGCLPEQTVDSLLDLRADEAAAPSVLVAQLPGQVPEVGCELPSTAGELIEDRTCNLTRNDLGRLRLQPGVRHAPATLRK